jgi:hypothetical protein
MDSSGTGKVEVIATAIDGDNLVLETVPERNEIRWPLKNLPRPLEIGSRLTLELQKDSAQASAALSKGMDDKDELKRKLLEELVN